MTTSGDAHGNGGSADAAAAAYAAALERCLKDKTFALVDDAVVLVYVDARRVFHPLHALVVEPTSNSNDTRHPTGQRWVLVLRLHAQVSALLRTLKMQAAGAKVQDVAHKIVTSLVLRKQPAAAGATGHDAAAAACVSFFADQVVNVEGGALTAYASCEAQALQAMTLVTMAMENAELAEAIADEHDALLVMVEHGDGYVGRQFSVADDVAERVESSRVLRVTRRAWNSDSVAQLSLDDVLEDFDDAYRAEQEINGEAGTITATSTSPHTIHIAIKSASEVKEQSHVSSSASSFFLEPAARSSSRGCGVPTVCLISRWSGIENVRSLLCKPPPQSSSLLCFPGCGDAGLHSANRRYSLTLLQNLERDVQHGIGAIAWSSSNLASSMHNDDPARVAQHFRRFLGNLDKDEPVEAADGNTNSTIESTISLTLDAERERSRAELERTDLDVVEKLWAFAAKHATSTATVLQFVQEFLVHLSTARVFSGPHSEHLGELANLVRVRQEDLRAPHATPQFTKAVQDLLIEPTRLVGAMIELGEWKMKRDVAHWLSQTGFSAHECDEFVGAMPRYSITPPSQEQGHWKAMDHVMQLCSLGRSISLPVSFMRKLVHECVGFYARRGAPADTTAPSLAVDLSPFVPDRLRANIDAPLFWDMTMSFGHEPYYQHRLRICQDAFHPPSKSPTPEDALVLDDATLRELHRQIPEHALLLPSVVAFMSQLEDAKEEATHFMLEVGGSGTTRLDCTVRSLDVFP